LVNQDVKDLVNDALEGTMMGIAESLFKAAVNRGMVSSLQKLAWAAKSASKNRA
jgi:hypothetical protein